MNQQFQDRKNREFLSFKKDLSELYNHMNSEVRNIAICCDTIIEEECSAYLVQNKFIIMEKTHKHNYTVFKITW